MRALIKHFPFGVAARRVFAARGTSTLRSLARRLRPVLVAAVLAGLLPVAIVSSWTTSSLEGEARILQHDRAEHLASELQAALGVSEQIADTTAALVEPVRDRKEIESLLLR